MTNTLSTIFSRSNVLNALLALCTAVEFVYDMGTRFGTWYRNGGNQQIRTVIVNVIASIIWTAETLHLGFESLRTNGPTWIAQANELRNSIGKSFTYAV